MLVKIANREDTDQTASSKAVLSGSALFVYAFICRHLVLQILEHLPYMIIVMSISANDEALMITSDFIFMTVS